MSNVFLFTTENRVQEKQELILSVSFHHSQQCAQNPVLCSKFYKHIPLCSTFPQKSYATPDCLKNMPVKNAEWEHSQ